MHVIFNVESDIYIEHMNFLRLDLNKYTSLAYRITMSNFLISPIIPFKGAYLGDPRADGGWQMQVQGVASG